MASETKDTVTNSTPSTSTRDPIEQARVALIMQIRDCAEQTWLEIEKIQAPEKEDFAHEGDAELVEFILSQLQKVRQVQVNSSMAVAEIIAAFHKAFEEFFPINGRYPIQVKEKINHFLYQMLVLFFDAPNCETDAKVDAKTATAKLSEDTAEQLKQLKKIGQIPYFCSNPPYSNIFKMPMGLLVEANFNKLFFLIPPSSKEGCFLGLSALSPNKLSQFVRALRDTNLTTLVLRELYQLSAAQLQCLQDLNVNTVKLTGINKQVLQAFRGTPVTQFVLMNNGLGKLKKEELIEVLKGLENNPRVAKLDLYLNDLNELGVDGLAEVLKEVLRVIPSLKQLGLGGNNLVKFQINEISKIFSPLAKWPNSIKYINFSANYFPVQKTAHLLRALPTVRTFNLSHSIFPVKEEARILVDAMLENGQEVILDDNEFRQEVNRLLEELKASLISLLPVPLPDSLTKIITGYHFPLCPSTGPNDPPLLDDEVSTQEANSDIVPSATVALWDVSASPNAPPGLTSLFSKPIEPKDMSPKGPTQGFFPSPPQPCSSPNQTSANSPSPSQDTKNDGNKLE